MRPAAAGQPSGFRSSAITGTVLECAADGDEDDATPGDGGHEGARDPFERSQKTTAPAAAGALTGCPQPTRSPGSGRHVHRTPTARHIARPPGAVNRIGAGAPATALYLPCTHGPGRQNSRPAANLTRPVRAIPVAALDRDRDTTPSGPGDGRSSLLPATHCEHRRHCRYIWGIERARSNPARGFTTTWLCSS